MLNQKMLFLGSMSNIGKHEVTLEDIMRCLHKEFILSEAMNEDEFIVIFKQKRENDK